MAPVAKGGAKSTSRRPSKSASSAPPKSKGKRGPKPNPTEHKPKPPGKDKKKIPPHKRYSEKELQVPQLNGIRPVGVRKHPNAKKGKTFVDDQESMNAIMAMVMAEKEGNIESKMMRARQMEEVREARRVEAEKRAGEKKQKMDARKQEIKHANKRRRSDADASAAPVDTGGAANKAKRKRVSFG